MQDRESRRLAISIKVRLHLPNGEVEVQTRTISAGGFGAAIKLYALPDGTTFPVTLMLPNIMLKGTARLAYKGADEVCGFALQVAPDDELTWLDFINGEGQSEPLWRLIGRFATTNGDEKEALRSVLEKGRFGILFKRVIPASTPAPATPATPPPGPTEELTLRFHMVGENGEAYRVAFEKHGGVPAAQSDLEERMPGFRALAMKTVTRVLPADLVLRRFQDGPVQALRVVELSRGGFAAVLHKPPAPPGLVGLHGTEMIVVEASGEKVFPFFDDDDLERIAADTIRRESVSQPAKAPEKKPQLEERFSERYVHRVVENDAQNSADPLAPLRQRLAAESRMQTRTYGDRTIRLYPDVWLEVQRDDVELGMGVAMEDGDRICFLMLEGTGAPRVLRLKTGDTVKILRMRAQ